MIHVYDMSNLKKASFQKTSMGESNEEKVKKKRRIEERTKQKQRRTEKQGRKEEINLYKKMARRKEMTIFFFVN